MLMEKYADTRTSKLATITPSMLEERMMYTVRLEDRERFPQDSIPTEIETWSKDFALALCRAWVRPSISSRT